MSKKLENISDIVMDRIHRDEVKMRPRIYFIIGSLLAFAGLVAAIFTSIFFVGLMRFALRAHGPMGGYRLEQILSLFPWWTPTLAVLGLVIGIVILHRYDFSYKSNFKIIIVGLIVAVIAAGWFVDMTGVNDLLLRRGPMQGVMMQYLQEGNIQPGSGLHPGRGSFRP